MKTRKDLIDRLARVANRINISDARDINKVVDMLRCQSWPGALEAARSMDTMVREEIPSWGWVMMRNAVKAEELLTRYG